MAFVEVKRSRDGRHWHPHLHLILEGRYLHKYRLSDAWRLCTGDSYIVDVQLVREESKVVSYVTKYCTKPLDHSVFASDDSLDEAVLAMRGRHLAYAFGLWYRRLDDDASADPGDWVTVDRLDRILAAAARGEPGPAAVVALLWRVPDESGRRERSPPDL